MSKVKLIRYYINYFLPREVMGPVLIVFSSENIIDILFSQYLGPYNPLFGWTITLIASIALVAYWGEADEDMEVLEEQIEGDSQTSLDKEIG